MEPKHHILALVAVLGAHQGVTHFAISMRIMGKGDFFKNLMKPSADCRTRTAVRVLTWFSEHWPRDLEWPQQIPRPAKSEDVA